MKWHFTKYSGCGNDFILIDNRSAAAKTLSSPVVARLCHRYQGVGADGVILLENSSKADFRMRIFNADGSEAEMCGNGIRCLARFIRDLGCKESSFAIETMHSVIPVAIHDDKENTVKVTMPPPTNFLKDVSINVSWNHFDGHHIDTGVPHFVIFVDNIGDDTLLKHATAIRHHAQFQPKGANVNFAQINSRNVGNNQGKKTTIALRTYERGVEQETQACGTGAVATALIAAYTHNLEGPIAIQTRSQEILEVTFKRERDGDSPTLFKDITITGSAIKIFEGTAEVESV